MPPKGYKYSEDSDVGKKISDANKGRIAWNKGQKRSQESIDKQKITMSSIEFKESYSKIRSNVQTRISNTVEGKKEMSRRGKLLKDIKELKKIVKI